MKKLLLLLTVLFGVLSGAFAVNELTLEQALAKGLVRAEVRGLGYREGLNYANHGACIQMVLRNMTSNQLQIKLEPGRMLHPGNPQTQSMVVTEARTFVLAPTARRTYFLNAMCGERSDHSPSSTDVFTVGEMAKAPVQGLARLIHRHKYQDATGQAAMWCITDSSSITRIEDKDTSKTRILQQYVSAVTGQPLPEKTRQRMEPTRTLVTFDYELGSRQDVKMVLVNAAGQELETYYQIPAQAAGKYTLSARVRHGTHPPGPAEVRLLIGGEAVLTQPLTLLPY